MMLLSFFGGGGGGGGGKIVPNMPQTIYQSLIEANFPRSNIWSAIDIA